MPKKFTFTVNGQRVEVDAEADMPLLWVLRDKLGITGPKYGCGAGVCRACTSHLDGEEVQPCTVPVSECDSRKVTTIEGLADGETLHPVQQAWVDADVSQCGFCQPGQIMAAVALLKRTPEPTDADIEAIENMCRCGTYPRMRVAIQAAATMVDRPKQTREPKRQAEPRQSSAEAEPTEPPASRPTTQAPKPTEQKRPEDDESLIGSLFD